MAHDNMKKWLAVVADAPATTSTKSRMLTEDVDGVLKDIHSKVLARPEVSDTPDKIIARVAGGMRGVSKQEVQSGFDTLSKKNGFSSFADELKSAVGAHDEETKISEDLVDEEDMEEGNEFSGALAAAKAKGEKSFKVDGKTYPVKEDEEACPVCEAMPCECDGSKEEMISEEWSVLYDSAYATNMRASVRMQQGMNEDEVREWFNKAFQPLSIHEVLMRKPIDPKDKGLMPIVEPKPNTDPAGVLKPKPRPKPGDKNPNDKNAPEVYMGEEQIDEILPALAAGAARVGSAVAKGAQVVGSTALKGAQAVGSAVAKGAQAVGNVVAKGAQAAGTAASNAVVKGANVAGQAVGSFGQGMASQQQPAPGQPQQQQQQQQQQAGQQKLPGAGGQQKIKPGPINVDMRKKVIITPMGAIPFTKMITSEDREERDDAEHDEIKSALSDVHQKLKGDYDLDKQYDALHEVSEESGISYKDLLQAWVTHPSGMKEAIAAAQQSSEEQAAAMPAEEPPAEEPPAEEPAPEQQPVAESRKKAKGKKVLKEAHNVMLDVHDDHEVSMAQADLYRIVKDASALHNMLDNVNDLEGWVQAKITLASDYISKVKDYMEYDMIEANKRHSDPYEDATLFEADDEDEDDKSKEDADGDKIPHIVMQLRKAKDVDGNHKVKFEDGTSHYLPLKLVKKFLDKHDSLKPSQKDAMSRAAIKSLKSLKAQVE